MVPCPSSSSFAPEPQLCCRRLLSELIALSGVPPLLCSTRTQTALARYERAFTALRNGGDGKDDAAAGEALAVLSDEKGQWPEGAREMALSTGGMGQPLLVLAVRFPIGSPLSAMPSTLPPLPSFPHCSRPRWLLLAQ